MRAAGKIRPDSCRCPRDERSRRSSGFEFVLDLPEHFAGRFEVFTGITVHRAVCTMTRSGSLITSSATSEAKSRSWKRRCCGRPAMIQRTHSATPSAPCRPGSRPAIFSQPTAR